MTGLSQPITMMLDRKTNRISIDPPEPRVMVLGYGATRLLTKPGTDTPRSQRIQVSNLFDPYARLNDGHPWLFEAKKQEFDRFAQALSDLLPRADGAKLSRRKGVVYVEAPGVRDSLWNLSSGYQSILALALDVMSVMRLGWDDMQLAEGVVLIDEIDAHLHPRWKLRIVQKLKQIFPRLQFIATSHDPLTLRSLERDEVAILRRSLDGRVTAITADSADLPSPKQMRVDQLLTSEFFGLNSAEDMEADQLFEEYYRLLAQKDRTHEQEQRLEVLTLELNGGPLQGKSERERLVLEAADAYIADRKAVWSKTPQQDKLRIKATLQKLWAASAVKPPAVS